MSQTAKKMKGPLPSEPPMLNPIPVKKSDSEPRSLSKPNASDTKYLNMHNDFKHDEYEADLLVYTEALEVQLEELREWLVFIRGERKKGRKYDG